MTSVVKDTNWALEGEKVAGDVLIGPGATRACLVIPSNCQCDKAMAIATDQSVGPPSQRFVLSNLPSISGIGAPRAGWCSRHMEVCLNQLRGKSVAVPDAQVARKALNRSTRFQSPGEGLSPTNVVCLDRSIDRISSILCSELIIVDRPCASMCIR